LGAGWQPILFWLILSIWHITEIYRHNLVTGADWGIAIGYLIAWTVIALPVGTFHTTIHP
jgi:hypothetical protein